jgi:hypothetical protein
MCFFLKGSRLSFPFLFFETLNLETHLDTRLYLLMLGKGTQDLVLTVTRVSCKAGVHKAILLQV